MGSIHNLLRFITIMTPLNQHMREIQGEVAFLPYLAHTMLIVLEEHDGGHRGQRGLYQRL